MMKKLVYFLLSVVVLSTGAFTLNGCFAQRQGVKGTLSIAAFEGGYGSTWAQALADAYIGYNPEAQVKVVCNPLVRDEAVTAFKTNITSVDLFFIDGASIGSYTEIYQSLADISELYELTPKAGDKEENLKIKDKLLTEVVNEMTYGGDREEFKNKFYAAPSASGPCSLILNKDALNLVFGEGNWEAPRTTKEMIALADKISAANKKVNVGGINHTIYPMIYGGDAVEYWRYLYYAWMAQYDGIEIFNEMQALKTNGTYSKEAFNPDGKLLAFQHLEKFIKRANNYCDPVSMGNIFTTSQKYFVQKRACMYMTGDWFERELENATEYKSELMMIKAPITSDLTQKIEKEYMVSLGSTAAEKDKKLSEIIKAIDENKSSYDGIAPNVFAAIKEARSLVFSLANNALGIVPAVSINKDIAIDFLRFMYSDEGIAIVKKETKAMIPVKNAKDFNGGESNSGFRKSIDTIFQNDVKYVFTSTRDPIRYRAGLDEFVSNEKPEVAMGKKSGAQTARQYLDKEVSALDKSWADYTKLL